MRSGAPLEPFSSEQLAIVVYTVGLPDMVCPNGRKAEIAGEVTYGRSITKISSEAGKAEARQKCQRQPEEATIYRRQAIPEKVNDRVRSARPRLWRSGSVTSRGTTPGM
jgi:hypothetical protein